MDSGFRRKDGAGGRPEWRRGSWSGGGEAGVTGGGSRNDGSGGGVDGNSRAYDHREKTWVPAFAGKTEGGRSDGRWRCRWQLAGKRTPGGDVGSGFRRKDGRRAAGVTGGGGVYGNSRAYGHRGRDVDSGLRRKDGGGAGTTGGMPERRVGCRNGGWDAGTAGGMLELRVGCWNYGWDAGTTGGMLELRVGCWNYGWDAGTTGGMLELRVGCWCDGEDAGMTGGCRKDVAHLVRGGQLVLSRSSSLHETPG